MFHQCLYFQITKNDSANENKAIKGCSHKHNKVPQLSPSLQTPSNAIIEQATNNVPYTAESTAPYAELNVGRFFSRNSGPF